MEEVEVLRLLAPGSCYAADSWCVAQVAATNTSHQQEEQFGTVNILREQVLDFCLASAQNIELPARDGAVAVHISSRSVVARVANLSLAQPQVRQIL